jgi:hypothetical protein
MPITRVSADPNNEHDLSLDVFQVQEAIEVYDGTLALAVDHLLNHIKILVSQAYLPGSSDLQQALSRHPVLKHHITDQGRPHGGLNGRSAERVLLTECQRLLDSVLEIARLTAWPETAQLAQVELGTIQEEVPFLDYRYDNDPFPSDRDHEEPRK